MTETIARRKRAEYVSIGAKQYAQEHSIEAVNAMTPWIRDGYSHTTVYKEDAQQFALTRINLITRGYEEVLNTDSHCEFRIPLAKLEEEQKRQHKLAMAVSEPKAGKKDGITTTVEQERAVSTADLL